MAAVPQTGCAGNFSLTGHNARVASWSADLIQDVNDASGFSSACWRENIGGMKVLRGTAAGYLISNAASTAPAADFTATNDQTGVAFTLTAKTGCTYNGTAILSNARIGVDVNGANTVSFSFVSTGAVTETWANT